MLFLQLYIDNHKYIVESNCISTIVPLVEMLPIENVPECFVGKIVFHQQIIPIIDLSRLFFGKDCNKRLSTRIVILEEAESKGNRIGLLSEKVIDTLELDDLSGLNVKNQKDQPYFEDVVHGNELLQKILIQRIFNEFRQVIANKKVYC